LAIDRAHRNRSEQIVLNQLGIGYIDRGNYPEAIQALSQSLAIDWQRSNRGF
jgi:hypothetical protein